MKVLRAGLDTDCPSATLAGVPVGFAGPYADSRVIFVYNARFLLTGKRIPGVSIHAAAALKG